MDFLCTWILLFCHLEPVFKKKLILKMKKSVYGNGLTTTIKTLAELHKKKPCDREVDLLLH